MRILDYWHFDLEDVELVREARSSLQRSVPAATTSLLTLGGVASLRLELAVEGEETGLALATLASIRQQRPFELALAESILLVGDEEETRPLFRSLCEDVVAVSSFAGELSVCTTSRTGPRPLLLVTAAEVDRSLLDEALPNLDLALSRLETQAALAGEEVSRVGRARRGSDDAIGRMLHEGVVEQEEGEERVARMHGRVRQLTSIYGPLATDSVMLQEAVDRLADLERRAEKAIDRVSDDAQNLIEYVRELAADARRNLEGEQRFLSASLDKANTAIDVLRTQVELERSEQSLNLAERTLAIQVAAGFVEFVLVFYYVEHSWEPLAGPHVFEAIPVWIRFGILAVFSGVVVLATHHLSEALRERERRHYVWFAALLVLLVVLVAAMFVVSALFA